MNKRWYTSDLHFGHKKIVEYTNRSEAKMGPYDVTSENHDLWLIDLWNSQVHKSDTVVHIGDFSFYKDIFKTMNIMDQLNGNIILIKGNHDHSDKFEQYSFHKKVIEATQYKETRVAGVHTCLFHFPIAVWHKQHHGSWHLHGHSHGMYTEGKGKILDAGLDNSYNIYGKHVFFSEDMIADYMKNRATISLDGHTAKEGDI